MRRSVLVGVLALAVAAVAIYFVVSGSSDDTCAYSEARVDGDCEALRPGKPVDPARVAESIALSATDEDPAVDTLFARCAFQGIAAGKVDAYLCVVTYVGAPITLRLEHDRDGPTYRVTVLTDPQRKAFTTSDPGDDATVECSYHGNPRCE